MGLVFRAPSLTGNRHWNEIGSIEPIFGKGV